jgi:hypothetical protein
MNFRFKFLFLAPIRLTGAKKSIMSSFSKIIQGKRNKRNGDFAEALAVEALRRAGFRCVEPIRTGWIIKRHGVQIVGAVPLDKVSGDIKAIAPGGRAVHCEVKYVPDGNLCWSVFTRKGKDHQIRCLNETVEAGGLGLVVWIRSAGQVFLLRWPIPGFIPGKGLTWREADDLSAVFESEHFHATGNL